MGERPADPDVAAEPAGGRREPNTHLDVDPRLVGRPVILEEGSARVELETIPVMAADGRGLVHGGFLFGLADYAAMLAVNEPTVVLAGSTSRFKRPVVVGERIEAEATLRERDGRKARVEVLVRRGDEVVYEGEFQAYVPEMHVLD